MKCALAPVQNWERGEIERMTESVSQSDEAKPKPTKRRPRFRAFLRGSALLFGLLLALLAVDYRAYPYGRAAGGKSFNQGDNGLWLRYTWYFGQHTAAETELLARHLQERQIRYAYFHVRSITGAGKLAFHYPAQARRLIAALHHSAPSVKALAWVYVGNAQGQGSVRLSDKAVRTAMISEAFWLVNECGFDGVQWDYEICEDGDPDFLALMRETRAALPADKILSVATPIRFPLRRFGWSDAYFSQVALNCDQMTVMCYDTGFYFPRSYVWLVRQQALTIPQTVARANPRCRILLGLPTYGPGFLSHNPRAENIKMALRGVREGLSEAEPNVGSFAGVALFADYTTEPDEWDTYRKLWLTP